MAALPSLPAEMLNEILQYLHLGDPADVENLAISCRQLRGPCIPYIEADRGLKKMKADFKYSMRRGFPDVALVSILKNPRLRYLVDDLLLSGTPYDIDYADIDVLMPIYDKIVKESDTVATYQVIDRERRFIRGIHEENAIAMLLTLIPNLKRLVLKGILDRESVISHAVRAIARSTSKIQLNKLKELKIIPAPDVDQLGGKTDLKLLRAFAELPSVTKIDSHGTTHFAEYLGPPVVVDRLSYISQSMGEISLSDPHKRYQNTDKGVK